MKTPTFETLAGLHRKHIGAGPVNLAQISAVIRREKRMPWVSRELLRELRAEHAIIGRAIALSAVALLATGCATLVPDAITAEVGHESHVTQHAPCTDHPTEYGRNTIGLAARWERGRFFGEVSEGYAFHGNDGSPAPKDVFEARVGVDLWRKN